jgi:hypothetical protein
MKHDRLAHEKRFKRCYKFSMRTARFEMFRVSRKIAPLDFQKKEVSVVYSGDEPMRNMTVRGNEKGRDTCECRFELSICVTPYA